MNTIELMIRKQRSTLVGHYPFFGYNALRLGILVTPHIETAAVDGRLLIFNPTFVSSLTSSQLLSLVAHQVLHVVQMHHLRMGIRDPNLWNIAADYVINLVLMQAGFVLGKGWLIEEKYRNMDTETVYDLLKQRQAQDPSSIPAPCAWGSVMEMTNADGSALNHQQRRSEIAQVKAAIIQAAKAESTATKGNIPAWMKEALDDARESEVDWRDALNDWARKGATPTRFTWARPSKRGLGIGVYLPSVVREDAGPIAGWIDSSKSMDQRALSGLREELTGISLTVQPEHITVAWGDTGYCGHQDFARGEPVDLQEIEGRGGTSLRAAVEWLGENCRNAAGWIILTDLLDDDYGDDLAKEYGVPIIWCVTGTAYRRWRHRPSYGTIINVREED